MPSIMAVQCVVLASYSRVGRWEGGRGGGRGEGRKESGELRPNASEDLGLQRRTRESSFFSNQHVLS